MIKKLFIPLTFILVWTVACENNSKKDDELIENEPVVNDCKTIQLAEIIAKSLKNENISKFIQEEATKEFDGDNNIVLTLAYNKKIQTNNGSLKNKTTFLEALVNSTTSSVKSSELDYSRIETTELFRELEKEHPLMQISIPDVYLDEANPIDFSKITPHVVVLPKNYDETTTKTLTAIDNDGNSYTIDAAVPPIDPVLVIRENERLIAVPKEDLKLKRLAADLIMYDCIVEKKLEPDFETDRHNYYYREKLHDCNHGNFNGNLPITPIVHKYDRDKNNAQDNLLKARFVSKSALRSVESWVLGKPEVKLVVVFASNSSGGKSFGTLTKYLGKKGWYHRKWFKFKMDTKTLNLPILQWDKETFGDAMKYTFIEEDHSWSEKDLTVNFSSKIDNNKTITVNTKIKVGKQDKEMGEALIQYINPTKGDGTKHSTGILDFWVNQK